MCLVFPSMLDVLRGKGDEQRKFLNPCLLILLGG